jgi:hypothetical protein
VKCGEPGCGQDLSDLEALIVHSSVHDDDAFRDAVVMEFFHPEISETDVC